MQKLALKLEVLRPDTASEKTTSRTTFCSFVTAPSSEEKAMYGAYIRPTGLHPEPELCSLHLLLYTAR